MAFLLQENNKCLQLLLTSPFLQVFVLSGVIAMVTCAVFLRLNSLLKLVVLLLAVVVYSYLIHMAFLILTHHDMLHRLVYTLQYTNCGDRLVVIFINLINLFLS